MHRLCTTLKVRGDEKRGVPNANGSRDAAPQPPKQEEPSVPERARACRGLVLLGMSRPHVNGSVQPRRGEQTVDTEDTHAADVPSSQKSCARSVTSVSAVFPPRLWPMRWMGWSASHCVISPWPV